MAFLTSTSPRVTLSSPYSCPVIIRDPIQIPFPGTVSPSISTSHLFKDYFWEVDVEGMGDIYWSFLILFRSWWWDALLINCSGQNAADAAVVKMIPQCCWVGYFLDFQPGLMKEWWYVSKSWWCVNGRETAACGVPLYCWPCPSRR